MIKHIEPLLLLGLSLLTTTTLAAEVKLNGHNFRLPSGFTIEKVAGPPLVDRPICADFDEAGRLYVADSSGSNDPVEEQVKHPTHRILRLEDADGDGVFDKSVVFADRMMFPEGTLWYGGSLYVAAPPSIWKLTDTDGDGAADRREEWFQGKTLTHCANDLHGPYLGPDGWFYWCKGAYAEQTYERVGKPPFVTKAAHIFRCRPDAPRDPETGSVLTSAVEPVMTGGMANPVDVTFTPGGERIFTTTFLVRPQAGLRDGLIHAVYGGVYGQRNDARLAGHKRTGELMPVLLHTGAAAPCGLTRYESRVFGEEYQDNLFACLFNMRKVTRHVLKTSGATFTTQLEDFLVSDHLDFHPTDVLEDADGSLLVIDTGGWYKLCCPTSQLEKPDVLGAIYRVRRANAPPVGDPRGAELAWSKLSPDKLAALLDDPRPVVQRRAIHELAARGADAVQPLAGKLQVNGSTPTARRNAVWALTRIDHADARAAVRQAISDPDETVRQAAIHSISLRRDRDATVDLARLLNCDSLHNRRAAAEALGRIGEKAAVPALLESASQSVDRVLEHSLTYALIEIADANQTRAALSSSNTGSRRAALMALDQMDGGSLKADEAVPLLSSDDATLKDTAGWIVDHHPDWAAATVPYFRERIRQIETSSAGQKDGLQQRLARFAATKPVQQLLGESLAGERLSHEASRLVLQAMAQSGLKELPPSWVVSLTRSLGDASLAADTVAVLNSVRAPKSGADDLVAALLRVAENPKAPADLRLQSLAAVRHLVKNMHDDVFEFVSRHVDGELPVNMRAAAVEILAAVGLKSPQLISLAGRLKTVSPLDINRLLAAFERSRDEQVGLALVDALMHSPARSALRVETLKPRLAKFPPAVHQRADELYRLMETETADQRTRLQNVQTSLPAGDVRRGQEVFHSAKAACSACHAIGYLGGRVGPDLTRIARTRSQRDLLESIVFPSASLVQNYEPVAIVTADGRVFNGLIQRETKDELVLATGPDKEARLARNEIEAIQRSKVSIMPAGLDKQLTPQQLADLVEFLKTRK
jgi:putative membrane-bound dehydrogenase-like protein